VIVQRDAMRATMVELGAIELPSRMATSDLDELLPPPGAYPCRGRCGVIIPRPGVCSRCAGQLETDERSRAIRASLRREIPERFGWARWSAPELAQRVAGGARRVDDARRALVRPCALLLGGAGSGKSSLACAWMREHIEAGVERVRFVPALELAGPSYIDGVSRLDLAVSASRLVLDDLGEELTGAMGGNLAAQRIEAVVRLVRARHDQGLGLVVTTGRDQDWIARTYGDGIARRLFEGVAPVRLA
jgi:hypothetical protein